MALLRRLTGFLALSVALGAHAQTQSQADIDAQIRAVMDPSAAPATPSIPAKAATAAAPAAPGTPGAAAPTAPPGYAGVPQQGAVLPPLDCSQPAHHLANAGAVGLGDWNALYQAYRSYGGCEDDASGAAFSEAVTHLLAANWAQFAAVAPQIQQDPVYYSFLLRHIDHDAANAQEWGQIAVNARQVCPAGAQQLCSSILQMVAASESSGGE